MTLEEYIKEWNARVGRRLKFLEKNSMVQYEEFEKLVKGKKLDSNLKKCTAFVRKMVSLVAVITFLTNRNLHL